MEEKSRMSQTQRAYNNDGGKWSQVSKATRHGTARHIYRMHGVYIDMMCAATRIDDNDDDDGSSQSKTNRDTQSV